MLKNELIKLLETTDNKGVQLCCNNKTNISSYYTITKLEDSFTYPEKNNIYD